jgi:alanyl-tRNA synthetase
LEVSLKVDTARRRPIEAHHSATHIMHWALHQHVGKEVSQQGSLVAPDRLRFDFNSDALTPEQIAAVEKAVNEKVAEGGAVSWKEVPHADVKDRSDIMQFFGDKYGDTVRVVQIGGEAGALDGYSMELCGGTHVRDTSEIGKFIIKSEGAIAAGTRRIEAVSGEAADAFVAERVTALKEEAEGFEAKFAKAGSALGEDATEAPASPDGADLAAWTTYRDAIKTAAANADKALKKQQSAGAAAEADAKLVELIEAAGGDVPLIAEPFEGSPALLQELLNGVKKRQFAGVAVFTVNDGDKVHLGVVVAKAFTERFQAGALLGDLAPLIGGKGGGKPEMARGAGGDPSGVEALIAKARELVS